MRRRRARCSLRGCPLGGAVCGAGRDGARALAAHRCNCKRARLCRCVGVAAGCGDGHACFRPRLATDRIREMRERRRVLSVRSASSGRSSGAGENRRRSEFFRARAGVRYDYSFCQLREQRNTAFPGALYLHRELLSNRCISSLIETAAETHSFLPVSLRPRACPSFHATTRQRRELSYTATAQKCLPRPCAAPPRKAVAS